MFKVNFTENMTEEDIKEIETDIEYELTIENDIKRGSLQIVKVDKDDNEIYIPNAKFEVIDETTNEVIGVITTNENGIAVIDNLRIDHTFSIKEIETDYKYELEENIVTNIKIEADKATTIQIENEKIKGQIRVIKVDAEDNKVLIPGVEFEILDKDMNIIEVLTTDETGEAISSELPVVDEIYYLRESKNNDLYQLSDEIIEIELKANEITDIVFENEAKTAQLQIIKKDSEDNNIFIPDTEFEVIDETTNEVIRIVATNENGIAVMDNLKVTHSYSIREVKSNNKYKLNGETITNIILKPDEITNITVENEKKKGQIKVIKVDADKNEVKIEGVTFEILDEKMNVIEEIITDANGEAVSSMLPCIDTKYYVREKTTQEMYVLSEEIKMVTLAEDQITNLVFENEKIKGYIQIVKVSADDNPITGEKAGTPIENVEFEIYDSNGNIVDKIITNKEGIATTDKLVKGIYTIKEVKQGKFYKLNTEEYTAEINNNLEVINVQITNESDKPNVDIEKTGIIQTTANEEIRYDFNIKNTGNVELDNFTWYDYLPYDDTKITKLITGTYNQNLNYNIYYKTNLNDYRILAENLNTQVNNYIDFSNIELEAGEIITEFKVDFGTVDTGFESVIDPYIFVKVNSIVEADESFTNKTRIEGEHEQYLVWDEDEHTTTVYKKEIKLKEIKKLPRTGC